MVQLTEMFDQIIQKLQIEMFVLEFRKARESRNVVRTMLEKYLHIVLFTKTRYSSFLNHNFSKISNIKEQILLWGIIGEANFTFLNLKYEEIHISQPSVCFAGFWTQNKQDPVSTMQKTGWTIHSSSWSCQVWKRVSLWMWSLRGCQQPFPCILCHFRQGDKQTNELTTRWS